MYKAIAIVRTSTDRQTIKDQHSELLNFILADGYKESEIYFAEKCGASAIKLDDAYKANMERVYKCISENDILCVYGWALDRIGRDEELMMNFKNRLIKSKIQLKIKNPALTLLEPDGSVNAGMELCFSLFVTMAKQEMLTKQARFTRTKRANAESGKTNGGKPAFGYCIDPSGYIVPDPTNAETVRMIFAQYLQPYMSIGKLSNWLIERGFNISQITLRYILHFTGYIGQTEQYYDKERTRIQSKRKYIPIISRETWDAVQSKLEERGCVDRSSIHHYFGNHLFVCAKCGSVMVGSNRGYRCVSRANSHGHKCDSELTIDPAQVDGMLWTIAQECEIKYNSVERDKAIDETLDQISDIKVQIEANERVLGAFSDRISKIVDSYVDSLINKEQRDAKIDRIKAQTSETESVISTLRAQLSALERRLRAIQDEEMTGEDLVRLANNLHSLEDEAVMHALVHKHIAKLTCNHASFSHYIKELRFECVNGEVKYMYLQPSGKQYKWYISEGYGKVENMNQLHPVKEYPIVRIIGGGIYSVESWSKHNSDRNAVIAGVIKRNKNVEIYNRKMCESATEINRI